MRIWRRPPQRDARSLGQNQRTQPPRPQRVFARPGVVTEGWHPVCASRDLPVGRARSFDFLAQRIVVWRGRDLGVRATDAFCAHMGADLGNGAVVGDTLRCYFHRWRYDGDGEVVEAPCRGGAPRGARVPAWPVEERYGWIWVFAAPEAPAGVPAPPGLEGQETDAWHLGSIQLYAHHHVMMASGIDLAHFASVHELDIDFELRVEEEGPDTFVWCLEGELPHQGWKARLGRRLLGERFAYRLRFAGGSVCAIAYGWDQRLGGQGRPLPSLHVLWGCVPQEHGLSRCEVFLVAPRGQGAGGWLAARARFLATLGLLLVLRDEDVGAFPRMRFDPAHLSAGDESVARLIQLVNRLPLSSWSHPDLEDVP